MEVPPYLASVKNLKSILTRIQEAGAPPKFTNEFLKSTLGFSSSTDRGIIAVLRSLGFITQDGQPTDRYNEFRSGESAGKAMAAGLREGWAGVFLSDQKANERSASQLKETFKTVTGKSESVAEKMATTFKTLSEYGSWAVDDATAPGQRLPQKENGAKLDQLTDGGKNSEVKNFPSLTLNHDIHIHLPPTSDVSVYKAIFRAIRDELVD